MINLYYCHEKNLIVDTIEQRDAEIRKGFTFFKISGDSPQMCHDEILKIKERIKETDEKDEKLYECGYQKGESIFKMILKLCGNAAEFAKLPEVSIPLGNFGEGIIDGFYDSLNSYFPEK